MTDAIHHNIAQNSNEWFELRLGRITASNMDKICDMFQKDGNMRKESNNYLNRLVFERTTKSVVSDSGFNGQAMQWGRDNERNALNAVQERLKENLSTCGIYESEHDFLASPDSVLIDNDFNTIPVEVKCPYNPHNHIDNVLTGSLFDRYKWQVHAQIVALGAPYGYFASFDPRLTGRGALHIMKIEASEDITIAIIDGVKKANDIINNRMQSFTDF